MDWQHLIPWILSSSFLGSLLATFLSPVFQHWNWGKQKKREEKLLIAKRILEQMDKINKAWLPGHPNEIPWDAVGEQGVLLSIALVLFEREQTRSRIVQYTTTLNSF